MSARLKLWPAPAAAVFALALLAAGCGDPADRSESLGEAWVGPATLNLRNEIPLNSGVAATLKHGQRVEIVQRRRRFIKVRARGGAEGWIEQHLLLSAAEMEALRDLNERAARLHSHGAATVFDLLNVHTTPARQAPSFTQVKQGDRMEVLLHRRLPRVTQERPPLIPPPPKRPPPARKRRSKPSEELPAPPSPPGPPENWLELSRTNLPDPEPEPEPPKPVPTDDWTLVRLPSGQAGWVLSRPLYMAIPDEVAQYAEGQRITSYFSLGEVQDGELKKHNWLWTTSSRSAEGIEFDSFRVFIWSLRRHRYETAYIERRLRGHFPVEIHPVKLGETTYPGFSVCTEREGGERVRRSFAFIVNVVRSAGEGPCKALPHIPTEPPAAEPPELVAAAKPAGRSIESIPIYGPLISRISGLARKWLGDSSE